jgi:dienelactone hydrolase
VTIDSTGALVDALGLGTPPAQGPAPAPGPVLQYFGGRTIPDLTFGTLYVGGEAAWEPADVSHIDDAIREAMSDARLNGVLAEYFPSSSVSATFAGSRILPGPAPPTLDRDDVEALLAELHRAGELPPGDPATTAYCFLLPRGVVLVDGRRDAARTDSRSGLAGYHGSLDADGVHLMYAVVVFSEDGNGVVAFDEPWKNVVATLYRALQEVRTNPDVEDAVREADPSLLGWMSQRGGEIGDAHLEERGPGLEDVMKEVRLANGKGTVPVQLLWSNAARAPAARQPRALAAAAAAEGALNWIGLPPTAAERRPIATNMGPVLGSLLFCKLRYLGWNGTPVFAYVVLPVAWRQHPPRRPVPLVISPHGRNNLAVANIPYWYDLPARWEFVLVCPDGVSRYHTGDDQGHTGLYTYGAPGHMKDLARMPQIVQDVLHARDVSVNVDPARIYVVGSSMGGEEALLLAGLTAPDGRLNRLGPAGEWRLAGAAAFDSTCDLAAQCRNLTGRPTGSDAIKTAIRMLHEVGVKPPPKYLSGFNLDARFGTTRVRDVVASLPSDPHPGVDLPNRWAQRSPTAYAAKLRDARFPIHLLYSSADTVVLRQKQDQTGKLFESIRSNPRVKCTVGTWFHSCEFGPDWHRVKIAGSRCQGTYVGRLDAALRSVGFPVPPAV